MRGSGKASTPVVPGSFTQTGHAVLDTYADINIGVYRDALSVLGKGYIRSLNLDAQIETATRTEVIIELDGTEKPPFIKHASGAGISDQLLQYGARAGHYFLNMVPMWRFETSFKVRVYGNHATATSIGITGNAEVWTE